MMALYDHYTVIGAKLRVRFINADTTANSMGCAIMTSDQVHTSNYESTVIEQPDSITALLGPKGSSRDTVVLTSAEAPLKFLGRKVGESSISGSISSNPADQLYWQIMVADPLNGVDPGIVTCEVTIDYTAIFMEPKFVTGS